VCQRNPIGQGLPAQHMVLVTCKDEKQQVELLERFQGEGLGPVAGRRVR
jgi:hypothetical protein